MRTIKGDVEEIGKLLDAIESKDEWRKLDSPEKVEMIDWILRHIAYTVRIADEVHNRPGRSKSYATAVERMRSQLKSVERAVHLWQTEGLRPE